MLGGGVGGLRLGGFELGLELGDALLGLIDLLDEVGELKLEQRQELVDLVEVVAALGVLEDHILDVCCGDAHVVPSWPCAFTSVSSHYSNGLP